MTTPARLGLYAVVEPSERPLRLARSLRTPEKLVVLEPVADLAFDSELAAMWIDEEVASRRSLALPGVVPLRDFFWAQPSPGQHLFCLAHEYLEAHSLSALLSAARLRHEPVPVPVALSITLDVLAAVGEVHGARSPDGTRLGMLVRGLTPERILVDAEGRAWLWQLLRRPGPPHDQGDVTAFAHLSPESVGGQPVAVTSDVYSVASVLWEMLAGRPRLPGRDLVALLGALLHAPPVAPSRWRPELPPELDALVLRCLSREPRARPVDAGAMTGELTALIATRAREQDHQRADQGLFRQQAPAPILPDGRASVAAWASALGAEPWPGPEVRWLGGNEAPRAEVASEQVSRRPYR